MMMVSKNDNAGHDDDENDRCDDYEDGDENDHFDDYEDDDDYTGNRR